MKNHKILVVGAGLSGATIARALYNRGWEVEVFEEGEIGGHCADEVWDDILIHTHGPHIWHNSDPQVQRFVEKFAEFNGYIHKCKAYRNGKVYSFPPNLETFYQIYGVRSVEAAKECDLAYMRGLLFDEYVKKQWGQEVPEWVTNRIPVRYTYNDRYYNDRWEGIPVDGYKDMIESMLIGIPVHRERYESSDGYPVVYTGAIDEFFKYEYGPLEYRSLRFEHERVEVQDYQGVAHMSYTGIDVPYTRIVEHKHFDPLGESFDLPYTWITREYPVEWEPGMKRFYPKFDREKYLKYFKLIPEDMYFLGRLGSYRYLNMNEAVRQALDLAMIINNEDIYRRGRRNAR